MNVLFVCEDNCALSLMAESILAAVGRGRFVAYSAGSAPGRSADPYVLDFLARRGMPAGGLQPKGLERFRNARAPRMDFIVTLCEMAATTSFDGFPGDPVIAHWNVQNDESSDGVEAARRDCFWTLLRRINIFTSLSHGKLSRRVIQERMLTLEPSYL